MDHRHIRLPGETDLPAFRDQARALLAAGIPPEAVEWQVSGRTETDLFSGGEAPLLPLPDSKKPAASVPAAFLSLCRSVILHSDTGRFGLLYRLLWRLVHEPGLRHDPLDPDRLQADRLAKAVRRDQHKMTAFVRFRTVSSPQPDEQPDLHVAWFEPEHHIVEATAPFFVRRFTNMHWAILTPRSSVQWFPPADEHAGRLEFGPGARREDAPPADAGETLWLTYYANIFNPARLKLAMMQKEMPRRYWHNLPEAQLISGLAAMAMERSGQMIDQAASVPARRIRPVAAPARPEIPVVIHRLSDLKPATDHCRECPIGQFATQAVAGEGPAGARLMVIGEQPGDQEDLQGRPFVGPAGKLFNRAVEQLGWRRDQL